MSNPRFLGIDTSNYTTSMAVVDHHGVVVEDCRLPLRVAEAKQGLRQSEALFQHVQHLPELMEDLGSRILMKDLQAIAVSTAPRPQRDSYMPVFLPGLGLARSLAAGFRIPMVELSHQEKHLWAAVHSAGGPSEQRFLAMHVSGGTTEILSVERRNMSLSIDLLGQSNDLHAGQMIDRVGVALGLPFPAGASMERLAQKSLSNLRLSSSVTGTNISFSGPCSQALRWIKSETPEDIARAVLVCVARSLEKVLRHTMGSEQTHVLASGGVMANRLVRQELERRIPHICFWFADPRFSTDNALGCAVAAWASQQPSAAKARLFPQSSVNNGA